MQEKKAVTRQVRSRYQKAGRKEKSAVPDECISITGYKNRKYAMRVLNKQAPALLFTKGGAARLKPAKPKPANRKGKKIYADNAIAALRLVRAFFRYKCGKLLAPLMRRQTVYIALWPVFGITADIREKLTRISPAAIGRALKNDRAALALKGKSLTESAGLLKHRIPVRTFHASEERKLPGFIQIDTARHCGQAASGQYILTAADAASGRICLYSLLNKARCRTFDAPMDIHANLPFPLREFHSDNGSEFINHVVTGWHRNPACPIPFTRSRDRKKKVLPEKGGEQFSAGPVEVFPQQFEHFRDRGIVAGLVDPVFLAFLNGLDCNGLTIQHPKRCFPDAVKLENCVFPAFAVREGKITRPVSATFHLFRPSGSREQNCVAIFSFLPW
jgi:hypothetical protein